MNRSPPDSTTRAMLVRERLLHRLSARWTEPIVVVIAPAGYGKTTLLRQAIQANRATPAGTDLDLQCTPRTRTLPTLASLLYSTIGASPSTPTNAGVDEIAATVIDAMSRRVPGQVALLIDDVHELSPGSEAAQVLQEVAASLPPNGHLVLCGRSAPPFPMARLETEGRVLYLSRDDLGFNQAESDQFAALRGISEDLVMSCGGWPALAELSARPGGGIARDYVGEEVLSELTPAERRDLAMLSHIGPFDDELAREVLGRQVDVAPLLARLPLVETADDSGWSLHELWRTFLDGELNPAEIARSQRRAGKELTARGQPATAVPLLIESAAWDLVAEAIIAALSAASPPVARDVLRDWYSRLPDAVRSEPSSQLVAAISAAEDRPEEASRRMEATAAVFRARDDIVGELTCLVQLGQHAWWTNHPGHLASVAARVLQMEAAGCDAAIPFACLGRALIFDMNDDSGRMLAELSRIPREALNDEWLAIIDWFRSIALLQLGHAAVAERMAEEAIARSSSEMSSLIESTRLQAIWFQGRAGEVFEALPHLDQRLEHSGSRQHLTLAAAQASVAYALHGNLDRAAESLDSARALASAITDSPLVDTVLAVAEAAMAVASGDNAAAQTYLTAYLQRHPIGDGIAVAVQRRYLPLFYVLIPESRPTWDAMELGPTWLVARDLAQAVVGVRRNGRRPSRPSVRENVGIVRAHLPIAWIAELGLAAVGAGDDDGWKLLNEAARPAVADIVDAGPAPLRKAARSVLARLPRQPRGVFELRLLGPVELRCDGNLVHTLNWRRDRVRSLLAYLVLRRIVGRQQIADDLWPDLAPDGQSRNLRVTLTYLLKVLEPDRSRRAPSFFVRQNGNSLVLHPDRWLEVDLWLFDEHCERAAAAEHSGALGKFLQEATQALALWHGDQTDLLTPTWVLSEFEQRRVRFATLAIRAGELYLARRQIDQACNLAERALSADPWLDDGHRLLIDAYGASGNELSRRRAVDRYRASLEELGVDADAAARLIDQKLEAPRPVHTPGAYGE